ncbi:MAG: hypothetical protein WDM92_09635 [Caulobacteraceae bacterium]
MTVSEHGALGVLRRRAVRRPRGPGRRAPGRGAARAGPGGCRGRHPPPTAIAWPLSLAETDPAMRPDPVLVADRKDGKPLDAHEGPFRLVVPGDKRPARSARSIVKIEIRALP